MRKTTQREWQDMRRAQEKRARRALTNYTSIEKEDWFATGENYEAHENKPIFVDYTNKPITGAAYVRLPPP